MRKLVVNLVIGIWVFAMAAPASAQPEQWRPVAQGPARPRTGAAAVWTGTEMIVLGGGRLVEVKDPALVQGSSSRLDGSRFGFAVRFQRDVAAYDPASDRWRSLAPIPSVDSSAWSAENVVWTGSEIVVPLTAVLLVYAPGTDTWRSVPYPDPKPQAGGAVVWTGRDVLFWGYPYHLPASRPWAQAYRPADDQWRTLDAGPLGFREYPGAAWTGSEMVVFGGRTSDTNAAAYDPNTDTWRAIAAIPTDNSFHTLAAWWTGHEVVALESGFGNEGSPIGIAYEPARDAWRTIAAPPAGIARAEYALTWTGSEVLVVDGSLRLTGSNERALTGGAGAYDPSSDSWRMLPQPPRSPTCDSALVWTGDAAVVWGGNQGCRIPTRPRPGTGILGR
jgi:hypothetical protein